jgi:hypothetical protein
MLHNSASSPLVPASEKLALSWADALLRQQLDSAHERATLAPLAKSHKGIDGASTPHNIPESASMSQLDAIAIPHQAHRAS